MNNINNQLTNYYFRIKKECYLDIVTLAELLRDKMKIHNNSCSKSCALTEFKSSDPYLSSIFFAETLIGFECVLQPEDRVEFDFVHGLIDHHPQRIESRKDDCKHTNIHK
jgi:hypothetical protein